MLKKVIPAFLMATLLFGGFIPFTSITGNITVQAEEGDSIKDRISNNETDLEKSVNSGGNTIVKTAREIAFTISFVLLIWIGYTMFFSGSSEGVASMKKRLGLLTVALIFVFFTEEILGLFFGLAGKEDMLNTILFLTN